MARGADAVRGGSRARRSRRRYRLRRAFLCALILVVAVLISVLIFYGYTAYGLAAAAVFFVVAGHPPATTAGRRRRMLRLLESRREEVEQVRSCVGRLEGEIARAVSDRPQTMELRRQRVFFGGLLRSLEAEIIYLEARVAELRKQRPRRRPSETPVRGEARRRR